MLRIGIMLRGKHPREFASDHPLSDFDCGKLPRGIDAYKHAVAQNRHAVADGADLFQAVRNEDDRRSRRFQFTHDAEENFRFVPVQNRGRFVHNQQPAFDGKRFCDFNHLFFRNAERPDHAVRINLHAETRQMTGRFRVHFRPVEKTEAMRFASEKDILRNRQIADEVELLRNPLYSRLSRPQRTAEETDRTGIGAVDAEQTLHQRRFSRAVLPDKSEDFARRNRQRNARQNARSAE